MTSWGSSVRPSSCPRWSGRSRAKGGTQMRKFLLIVGTLIILALGGLEVIAAAHPEEDQGGTHHQAGAQPRPDPGPPPPAPRASARAVAPAPQSRGTGECCC